MTLSAMLGLSATSTVTLADFRVEMSPKHYWIAKCPYTAHQFVVDSQSEGLAKCVADSEAITTTNCGLTYHPIQDVQLVLGAPMSNNYTNGYTQGQYVNIASVTFVYPKPKNDGSGQCELGETTDRPQYGGGYQSVAVVCDPTTYYFAAQGSPDAWFVCVVPLREDVGLQCPSDGVGHPINPRTGVKFLPEVDYAGPDGLRFERTYRSSLGYFASVVTAGILLPTDNPLRWEPAAARGCFPGHYRHPVTGQPVPYCFPISGLRNASTGASVTAVVNPSGRVLPLDTSGARPVVTTNPGLTVLVNSDPLDTDWHWEFIWEDDHHERYDVFGKLVLSWPRAGIGWATTYAYSDADTPSSIAPWPGLLIAMTNASGRSLQFSYDTAGRMVKMLDPAGGMYRYAYDTDGNLTSVSDSTGATRRYVYNEASQLPSGPSTRGYPHLLTGIVDETGQRYESLRYDGSGRGIETTLLGTVADVAGQPVERYQLSYPSHATVAGSTGLTQITDPLGQSHDYRYQVDSLGVTRPTSFSQPAGQGCGPSASGTSYDSAGNAIDRRDFNGTLTHTQWDPGRQLQRSITEVLTGSVGGSLTTTAATRAEIREYHPEFRLPTRITEAESALPPGSAFREALLTGFSVRRITDLHYDDHTGNRLRRTVSDPSTGASRTWTYQYDAQGRLQTADGPRTEVADVTTYTWYAADDPDPGKRNNLASVTDPAGRVTRYTAYDAAGRLLRSEAPNGVVTTWTYDARGRVIEVATGGETTRYQRDGVGQIIHLTQPDGAGFEFRYDSAHRLIEVADGNGHRIHYRLDALGNRIDEQTYAAGGEMTERLRREVDALNRIEQVQGND